MADMPPLNTIAAFQSVFTADLLVERGMHLPKDPAVLITVLPELRRPHDTFASAFCTLSNRNNQGMDMRTALVEMNLEADDILLPVSSGAPVIDIFCPLFDFRAPLKVAVIRPLVMIDGLVSECHFESAVVVTAEDEFGTTVRLYLAVGLERMPTQLRQPVHKPYLKRLLLIA